MNKLSAMEQGGKINREVMLQLFRSARPGVTLQQLDSLAEKLIKERGGIPSFKGYDGFPAVICTNINNAMIHGLPTEYKLKEGDILTIDQGVYFEGYHTDHAWTNQIQNSSHKEEDPFLLAGKNASESAISQAVVGNRVGDISNAMQQAIEQAGYFVVKKYVGHGVGKELHEEPQIPCSGRPDTGQVLRDKQTLAIEVMYTSEKSKLSVAKDGWTVVAKDANLAALFERTIMVRRNNPIVLT